ncbi:hypothetical protein RUM43_008966 [Polyplax serrata]|uniref:Uncharacterized protein n=1 Tax=Polyplax serrata TaxID=468196 RepID=A0AAN8PVQ4_POLSC
MSRTKTYQIALDFWELNGLNWNGVDFWNSDGLNVLALWNVDGLDGLDVLALWNLNSLNGLALWNVDGLDGLELWELDGLDVLALWNLNGVDFWNLDGLNLLNWNSLDGLEGIALWNLDGLEGLSALALSALSVLSDVGEEELSVVGVVIAVGWASFVVDVFDDWLVGGFDVTLDGWNADDLFVDAWSHDGLVAGAGVGDDSWGWDVAWKTDGWLNFDWGLDVGGDDWNLLVWSWSAVGQSDWVFALDDDVSGDDGGFTGSAGLNSHSVVVVVAGGGGGVGDNDVVGTLASRDDNVIDTLASGYPELIQPERQSKINKLRERERERKRESSSEEEEEEEETSHVEKTYGSVDLGNDGQNDKTLGDHFRNVRISN